MPADHQVSNTTQILIDLITQRDRAGREKYGTSLDRGDLSLAEWLQHMTEELLDGAGYAQAALRALQGVHELERELATANFAWRSVMSLVEQLAPEAFSPKLPGTNHERVLGVIRDLGIRAQQSAPRALSGHYIASFRHSRSDAFVCWWRPDNKGYTSDLEQAGIYHDVKPGYHDDAGTVPVPVAFVRSLRIRQVVDIGDSLNNAFCSEDALRAALAFVAGLDPAPSPHP
jgi:hypothetical protein